MTIDSGGSFGYFVKQPNGTYLDTDGEYGTLTQSGGIYTFTATSGTQFVFLANGLLNYEQDTNGNRITLGYNAQNQLITLDLLQPVRSFRADRAADARPTTPRASCRRWPTAPAIPGPTSMTRPAICSR